MSKTYPVEKLRRAMLQFLGGRAVQAIARAVLVLLVVRLLPIADYGAYMLIIGVAEMLLQMCSFGLLPVGQRFLPEMADSASVRDTRRFLATLMLLQLLVLCLICSLIYTYWGDILPYMGFTAEQIERSRPAVVLFLLIPAFRFIADMLEALLEQGKAQMARALMPLGRIAAVGGLMFAGVEVTLENILFLDGAVTLFCLLLAWILMVFSLRKLVEPEVAKPLPLRAMARHAWHMSAVELLGSTSQPGALRMVLANSLGIVESGLFAFMQSLQRLVGRYLPGVLLRGLVRPMLISRAQNRNGMVLLEHGVGLLLKSNLLIIAAAAMVVSFGGDRIIQVASGGKFTEAGDTLLLMFLALACTSQRQVIEMLLQVLNQTQVLRATAFFGPISLALVWYVAQYGLNAAIVAAALGTSSINVLNMWRLRVLTGRFPVDWWGAGGIMLPAVLAAVFGQTVQGTIGTWFAMGLSGLLLAALMMLAKPFASGELQLVDRGIGAVGSRMLAPFARKAAV